VSIIWCDLIVLKADADMAGGSGTAADAASDKNPSQVCFCGCMSKCKISRMTAQSC